jgi:ubiquinone/menaquinone biosynthesis C-methylase UbiE
MAVLLLAIVAAALRDATQASWGTVLAHLGLITGGLSLLLILFAVRTTEEDQVRRRQFGIGLLLLVMAAVGMVLAGTAGIFRLVQFDPRRTTVQGWAAVGTLLVLITLFGLPLLLHLLEFAIRMANGILRLSAVRRRLARKQPAPQPASAPATPAQYIHGTSPLEQARLARLNRLTNGPFLEFLHVRPGMRVLEVGSGLGILAAEVAAAARDVEVVGVEQSGEQIAAAVQARGVRYVRADAHELPFEAGSFDLVYARYLLEHVADPRRVLGQMRRVVRAGGRVAVQENDISLVRVDPPCPAFERAWQALARCQRQLGGHPYVGRQLYRLFREAGFSQIELSVQPEWHWSLSPAFEPWIINLIDNLRGARQRLIDGGYCRDELIDAACGELEALLKRDDASATFMWDRAAAVA